MVCATLRRVLERDHEVIVVESAREALTLIGVGQRYDVILAVVREQLQLLRAGVDLDQ